jgi:hypothetical protein
MQLKLGEHTPPAGGLRCRAANHAPPIVVTPWCARREGRGRRRDAVGGTRDRALPNPNRDAGKNATAGSVPSCPRPGQSPVDAGPGSLRLVKLRSCSTTTACLSAPGSGKHVKLPFAFQQNLSPRRLFATVTLVRTSSLSLWLVLSLSASGAERVFDFGEMPAGQTPPGFRSVVAGTGKPGDWRIVMDEVPPLLAPLTDQAPVVTRRAVLAQLSQDPTDERFPMLIFDGETFADFTLTTRFKLVSGAVEQMAGIAFRLQDERNFYVIRASGLGGNVRFYKVVNGERSAPIGPQIKISQGAWHELKIECRGNRIQCWLDGREALPALADNTFTAGKIGFWTKSDAVSYFGETRVIYTPREPLAQAIVRDTLERNSRLLGLKIFTLDEKGEPRVVASKDAQDLGAPGGPAEKDTITQGHIYYARGKKSVAVVMPLRDRNGEPIAAVRLNMRSFAGQTEQNALVRATPIVKQMQARVQTLDELTR